MLFSEVERRELAEFFAKRFSDDSVRSLLARQAGIDAGDAQDDATDAWADLITTAQNRRRLPNLAIVASRTDLADQNLQAVCNLLGARARIVRNRVVTGLAAASIALGFGVAGWSAGSQSETPAVAVAEVAVEAPASEVLAAAELSEPALADVPEVEVAPIEPEGPAYTRTHTPPEERPSGPAWRNGRCTYDKESDFIGYWYAGEESPGRQGEVVTVELGVNVRQDYPGLHNEFDKRTKVRCILKRGDKVKLTAAPVLVPGDRFWVPLYHGDLVEEAPEENLVAVR